MHGFRPTWLCLTIDILTTNIFNHQVTVLWSTAHILFVQVFFAKSARAVEYTNCFSAEWQDCPNECPGYDTKQSHGEVPVILELWGTRSTPSLPSLPGPLLPGVVAPDRVLSISQIELNYVLMLNWTVWKRTVNMYKHGFGNNNIQWVICQKKKKKPQTKPVFLVASAVF